MNINKFKVGDFIVSEGQSPYGITNENGVYVVEKVIDDFKILISSIYYKGTPDEDGIFFTKESLNPWLKERDIETKWVVKDVYFRKIESPDKYVNEKNLEKAKIIPESNFKKDLITKGVW